MMHAKMDNFFIVLLFLFFNTCWTNCRVFCTTVIVTNSFAIAFGCLGFRSFYDSFFFWIVISGTIGFLCITMGFVICYVIYSMVKFMF